MFRLQKDLLKLARPAALADARGHTLGAALEHIDGDWAVRASRVLEPLASNGLVYNHLRAPVKAGAIRLHGQY